MSKWIQVVGTFNATSSTGEILGVQPAQVPAVTYYEVSDTKLIAQDAGGTGLAEVTVAPEYGSCGDDSEVGSFQVFMDLPEATRSLSLQHAGEEIAKFVPDSPQAAADGESFGFTPQAGHVLGLERSSPSETNASYVLQAREKGTGIWETLDIGVEVPEATSVDLKQFPDANVIEVRVLKSSGFSNVEIDRKEVDFSS